MPQKVDRTRHRQGAAEDQRQRIGEGQEIRLLLAGASAGLAGAVQVLGVQHRLIEGYSTGFGFVSVAVALLGGLDPLALIPSSLVSVIEGVVMLPGTLRNNLNHAIYGQDLAQRGRAGSPIVVSTQALDCAP